MRVSLRLNRGSPLDLATQTVPLASSPGYAEKRITEKAKCRQLCTRTTEACTETWEAVRAVLSQASAPGPGADSEKGLVGKYLGLIVFFSPECPEPKHPFPTPLVGE